MSRYSPENGRGDAREESRQCPDLFGRRTSGAQAELMSIIDQAAAGKPTLTRFMDLLRERGVDAVPSMNARGLNGMSYKFAGTCFRGSDLGRAYTARGLQHRKGVEYHPDRDLAAIRAALERVAQEPRANSGERATGKPERADRRRDRYTGLSRDQWNTLKEVGKFRTISVRDLIRYRYAGRYGDFQRDLRVLSRAGLLERKTAVHRNSGHTYDVIVLTRSGRNAAAAQSKRNGNGQQFYAGLVKPQEIRHDVGIYRMYQQERDAIERAGGRVRRAVMDFEIKKRLMSELNRRGQDPRDMARKSAIAVRHNIHIVDGRFVIPDLRVEYEARDGEASHVDLELATADYKSSQLAAKRAAGMKVYSSSGVLLGGPDTSSGGTPWEPDYMASL